MTRVLLLFILPMYLSASKILSYNIYDRTDRVDIMITFDTPYDGTIKQSVNDSVIQIKLQDASIESSKTKKLSSKYVKSISITPMQDHTQITAVIPPSVTLQASKTSDSYGLRLRFTETQPQQRTSTNAAGVEEADLGGLPTKKDTDLSASYYIVMIILIAGIITLYLLKNRVTPKTQKKQTSWLFNESASAQAPIQKSVPPQETQNNVSIRFQRSLNSENSVVMLDFAQQSYLVLMGKNNILLDRFTDNKPVSEDDFNMILQNRHEELEKFLNDAKDQREYLNVYKEKAASIEY